MPIVDGHNNINFIFLNSFIYFEEIEPKDCIITTYRDWAYLFAFVCIVPYTPPKNWNTGRQNLIKFYCLPLLCGQILLVGCGFIHSLLLFLNHTYIRLSQLSLSWHFSLTVCANGQIWILSLVSGVVRQHYIKMRYPAFIVTHCKETSQIQTGGWIFLCSCGVQNEIVVCPMMMLCTEALRCALTQIMIISHASAGSSSMLSYTR